MRVLYIYCHPLADSFHAAIRDAGLNGLKAGGHASDLLDLYAEAFQPALTADERRRYSDPARNRAGIESYVARIKSAEALVVQFPTWCFGPPAMLKGFFDRILVPGVAYDAVSAKPALTQIRRIVGVTTYGQSRLAALWMGEAPRNIVRRVLPSFTGGRAKVERHALYNVDGLSDAARQAFIERVERAMARL